MAPVAGSEGTPGKPRGGARRAAEAQATACSRGCCSLGVGRRSWPWSAWGDLVWAAIDFGPSRPRRRLGKWVFLALASVGAVACLFVVPVARTALLRRVGIPEDNRPPAEPAAAGTDQLSGR